MQKELAHELRLKLQTLPFADLVAGLVDTVETESRPDEGPAVRERFPVSYDTNIGGVECMGKEIVLTPDSARKSIIYFEDMGVTPTANSGRYFGFVASLRLVCWLNRANVVGDNYAHITGQAIAAIRAKITDKNPASLGMFKALSIRVSRIPIQDAGIFSRYTYREPDRQYLRPPFEFFAMDLICNYRLMAKCLPAQGWNNTICS